MNPGHWFYCISSIGPLRLVVLAEVNNDCSARLVIKCCVTLLVAVYPWFGLLFSVLRSVADPKSELDPLGLLDPDPNPRYGSRSGSFYYPAEMVRKTLILTVL